MLVLRFELLGPREICWRCHQRISATNPVSHFQKFTSKSSKHETQLVSTQKPLQSRNSIYNETYPA